MMSKPAAAALSIGVFLEAVGEVVETESVEDPLVGQVGLSNKFLWRVDVGPFQPVNGDLDRGHFCGSILSHTLPPKLSHG